MKQPDVVKIPMIGSVLGLSTSALGVFVKLLSLGSRMTVKGVMVNGHVFSSLEIFERIKCSLEARKAALEELEAKRLIGFVAQGRVMFINEAYEFYNGTSYTDEDLASVVGTVREAYGVDAAQQIAPIVRDAGKFKQVKSIDEYREEIKALYNLFGENRGRVLSYVGAFRTKTQMETGSKMDPVRHIRILDELLKISQTGLFSHNGKQYVATVEQLMSAIDSVVQRGLVHLKNHNYLKVVLINQPTKKDNSENRNEPVAGSAKSYR